MLKKLGQFKGYVKNKIATKVKGGVTIVEVLIVIAVLVVITYPLYKGVITTFFGSIKTWFQTITATIFA